ncbi:hypothetical protein AVEN_79036-1 [Araneus ventricosus]|uniref:CCHC-type domain-containing protein n=1 Tax=Araneus ventricosus TaxID=182803 RepID=A0A4Y2SS11_ARAVE|nr:hypothetical protein AVEN_79036-1 [Araneus ventricosus]
MSETSSVADFRETLELEPPPQDIPDQGQEDNELENSIRITSAHSLKEPSHYEELARVTTAALTKITAVLTKARVSSENKKLVQAELETLASVLFDKVEENGGLKAKVELLQAENAVLHEQLSNPRIQTHLQVPQEQPQQRQAQKTYSEILKGKAKKRPPPRHVSLVYPKSGETSSEEVKDTLIREVDLNKAKVGIKNIRKIAKGGIAIECRSNKDLGKLLDEINANQKIADKLEARTPNRKLPRVILYDIDRTVPKEQLLSKLTAQNELDGNALKILFSIRARTQQKCHWVIEAEPQEFKRILQKGKLSFEWSRLSLREFVRPTRCYKCNEYGHISTRCEGKETCPNCGEEGHKGPDCVNRHKCVACTAANTKYQKGYDTKHPATDCPSYLHEMVELRKRINYGSQ